MLFFFLSFFCRLNTEQKLGSSSLASLGKWVAASQLCYRALLFHFRLSELSQFLFCLDKGVSARFCLYSHTDFISLDFSKNKMSVIYVCHSSHFFRKRTRTSGKWVTTPTARWSFCLAAAFIYVLIQPFRGSSQGSALAESLVWEASNTGTGFGLLMVPSSLE